MIFRGDAPYVLVVLTSDRQVAIDLDEPGWMKTHADLMRTPGHWILARKDSTPVLEMVVHAGEQPYCAQKVVGTAILPPPDALGISQDEALEVRSRAEVRAYGIGKKRLDGHTDRMWVLPNGLICAGEDVEELGEAMSKANLRAALTSKRSQNGDSPLPPDSAVRDGRLPAPETPVSNVEQETEA